MRRFLTLVCLLCVALPAGVSISGCYRNPQANYCNGLGYGLKNTDVASIFLSPQTTGLSLAFGQTQQMAGPTAKTCKGTAASVSSFTYGTTNNQLVDISPNGNLCAGTWNRNNGGGIANYTICSKPNPLPATAAGTDSLPYGVAYITATANSVTSNPVAIYIHPQVTSVELSGPTSCLSQGTLYPNPLDVQACFTGADNQQHLLCAPPSVTTAVNPTLACQLPFANGMGGAQIPLSAIPDCTAPLGTLAYNVANGSVASINAETNQITAGLPGTTLINAAIAGGVSTAGYFSTCPPASIKVTLANGSTSGTITTGVAQNLTTTIYDNNFTQCPGTGCLITGMTMDYQSTDPIDIAVGNSGTISANFPGEASIYAICQPGSCNPAPINKTGIYGTGLSIASNPVTIRVPGTASNYLWLASPGQSQYFVPVELISGTIGSTTRLPYVPNSMVMDRNGVNLYFGSQRELMIISTTTNTISKQDTTVPGVVLAVSPNNGQVLINDQIRQVFYIYGSGGGSSSTFGGMGVAAEWTPDAKTLYITDSAAAGPGHTDTLYVFNVNTGWTSYPLAQSGGGTGNPGGAQSLAITIPGVGAYMSGNPTVAHTWCPETVPPSPTFPLGVEFYPQGDSVATDTDVLTATTDGRHILGAAVNGGAISLSDIGITIPSDPTSNTPVACTVSPTGVLSALNLTHTFTGPIAVNGVSASAVSQVVPSPQSSVAFITYLPTANAAGGASLPYYIPASGTVGYVTLNGAAAVTAAVTGAFAPDDSLFFVATAGDNQVHYITIPQSVSAATPPTDTQQITPNLPACVPGADPNCILTNATVPASGIVPVTVIAVKPRSTT